MSISISNVIRENPSVPPGVKTLEGKGIPLSLILAGNTRAIDEYAFKNNIELPSNLDLKAVCAEANKVKYNCANEKNNNKNLLFSGSANKGQNPTPEDAGKKLDFSA